MRIDIPSEYIELCTNWHSGQDSIFYAISSTGSLSLGTQRPLDCEKDEDWMLVLLNSLESEIRDCLRFAGKETSIDEDFEGLTNFMGFTVRKIAEIEEKLYVDALSSVYSRNTL